MTGSDDEETDIVTDTPQRVVVVGASAAGLRCASRLARLRPGWRIIVVEARDEFSYGACGFPYVLSGDIEDLEELHRTADGTTRDADYFAQVKGVEVLAGWRAVGIDAAGRALLLEDAEGGERSLPWDELVLAAGARPLRLPDQPDHPRVVTFHTAADVRELHGRLARGEIRKAVLVGAGFLGCELAEAFVALWGAEVTLIEQADSPLPARLYPEVGAVVAHALRENDVDLRLGTGVERIEPTDDDVTVHLAGGGSVVGDVAVVGIGVAPAVELAETADIRLGPTGAIAVDERLATSAPHVWAAGDVVEVRHTITNEPAWLPLGSLANRQGRTLANVLAGIDDRFPPVAGAAALKVFDLNVASVGLSRTEAIARGDDVRAVWIASHDSADYWPEAAEILVQLTYRPLSRQVVGVQAVGPGEVVKRVDVATQLLQRGATLAEFAQLEHAYSPPYAPALDPLAVAAMVAENVEDGVAAGEPREQMAGARVLDVRNAEERAERPLGTVAAVEIPQDELRARRAELPGGPWLVVCERGPRAAEAVRWLAADGIAAHYLGGGLRWADLAGWRAATKQV